MFGKISQTLEKGVRNITNTLRAIAMGVLVVLMLFGATDIIGRYLLNKPIKGSNGICEALLVAIVFFGWAYTLSVGGHVRLDTLVSRLRPRAQAISGFITSFIALVIFSLITWQSALKAMRSWGTREVIDVIDIPIFPFQFFVSVGAFALCLELIVQMLHFLTGLRKGA